MRQETVGDNALGQSTQKSSKSRGAAKKAYFARNKDFAISNKNRDKGLARRKRRAEYWASPAGKARKEAKWNTPEKIKQRAKALLARDARRRSRQETAQQNPQSTSL